VMELSFLFSVARQCKISHLWCSVCWASLRFDPSVILFMLVSHVGHNQSEL
jgi:hypothetical protein